MCAGPSVELRANACFEVIKFNMEIGNNGLLVNPTLSRIGDLADQSASYVAPPVGQSCFDTPATGTVALAHVFVVRAERVKHSGKVHV